MQDAELGLERGVVRLVPHQPQWMHAFTVERARLQAAIGPHVLDIQHIGSTAIPGIYAKPIIDIGIAVASYEGAFVCVPALESIGYTYKGEAGIPRRHYYDDGDPCRFHLHLLEQAGEEWEAHLLFRDYLIKHSDTAAEYSALKLRLAEQYRDVREQYTDAKTAFIQKVIDLSREERLP